MFDFSVKMPILPWLWLSDFGKMLVSCYSPSLVYFMYGDMGRIYIMLPEYSRLTRMLTIQSFFRPDRIILSQDNF